MPEDYRFHGQDPRLDDSVPGETVTVEELSRLLEPCGVWDDPDLLAPAADVVLRLTKDEVAALVRGETIHRQVESDIGHPDAMGVVTVELTGEA